MDYLEWAKNRWQAAEDKDSATSAALIAIGEELRRIRLILGQWASHEFLPKSIAKDDKALQDSIEKMRDVYFDNENL